jgi:hypothetical protein
LRVVQGESALRELRGSAAAGDATGKSAPRYDALKRHKRSRQSPPSLPRVLAVLSRCDAIEGQRKLLIDF